MQTVKASSNTGINNAQFQSNEMKYLLKTGSLSTFAGSAYPDLKYLRRSQKDIMQAQKSRNNVKKDQQDKKLKSNKLKTYASEKKIVTGLLIKYSKIFGKHRLETCETKRRKFGWIDNPEPNAQTDFMSPSRCIKLKQDYCNNVNLNGQLLHSSGRLDKQESRKHNYRQDMFKESRELGLQSIKYSMRRPELTRTHSSIQLG